MPPPVTQCTLSTSIASNSGSAMANGEEGRGARENASGMNPLNSHPERVWSKTQLAKKKKL